MDFYECCDLTKNYVQCKYIQCKKPGSDTSKHFIMTLFFSSLDQTLDKVRHSTYLIQYGSEVWIFQILGHSADEDITIRVKQSIGNLHSLIPYIIFFAHFDQNFKELQLVFITTLIFLKVKLISKSRQTQISNLFPIII